MNAAIHAESDFLVGVYPRVDACGIGVVISFEGSGGGKPALINVELTNYAAIQLAKKLVAAAEQHAKDTNKSVEYFRRQLAGAIKHDARAAIAKATGEKA